MSLLDPAASFTVADGAAEGGRVLLAAVDAPLWADPVMALEAILPADLSLLKDGRLRYSLLLNDEGGIVDDLIEQARAGRLADGFVGAVDAVGKLLAAHVPPRAADRNELDDHLVEI